MSTLSSLESAKLAGAADVVRQARKEWPSLKSNYSRLKRSGEAWKKMEQHANRAGVKNTGAAARASNAVGEVKRHGAKKGVGEAALGDFLGSTQASFGKKPGMSGALMKAKIEAEDGMLGSAKRIASKLRNKART